VGSIEGREVSWTGRSCPFDKRVIHEKRIGGFESLTYSEEPRATLASWLFFFLRRVPIAPEVALVRVGGIHLDAVPIKNEGVSGSFENLRFSP
jgi:hypothetical protein